MVGERTGDRASAGWLLTHQCPAPPPPLLISARLCGGGHRLSLPSPEVRALDAACVHELCMYASACVHSCVGGVSGWASWWGWMCAGGWVDMYGCAHVCAYVCLPVFLSGCPLAVLPSYLPVAFLPAYLSGCHCFFLQPFAAHSEVSRRRISIGLLCVAKRGYRKHCTLVQLVWGSPSSSSFLLSFPQKGNLAFVDGVLFFNEYYFE